LKFEKIAAVRGRIKGNEWMIGFKNVLSYSGIWATRSTISRYFTCWGQTQGG